ncbi:hypothetical protein [Lonepinella sp. MS14436]|uniref:hypothetical protein n=1 Tax=Lonepinella sp. MS14436 TaxID=3003619 RepID=UPI0036DE81AC
MSTLIQNFNFDWTAELNNTVTTSLSTSFGLPANAINRKTLDNIKRESKTELKRIIGALLAEVWLELKEQIPILLEKYKKEFSFEEFANDVKRLLSLIMQRVKVRFKEIIEELKEKGIKAFFEEVTSTLEAIFFSSARRIYTSIKQLFTAAVEAVKVILFNPERLSAANLIKRIMQIINTVITTILGTFINAQLNTLLIGVPYAAEISLFISSLITGLLALGANYFLEYSVIMQKVWRMVDMLFKNKYDLLLEDAQCLNAELDAYVTELARVEFSFNYQELNHFTAQLKITSSQIEKSELIKAEIERRNIELPYEYGNLDSVRSWLVGLQHK